MFSGIEYKFHFRNWILKLFEDFIVYMLNCQFSNEMFENFFFEHFEVNLKWLNDTRKMRTSVFVCVIEREREREKFY